MIFFEIFLKIFFWNFNLELQNWNDPYRVPNKRVERVSSRLYSDGEQQIIIDVLQFPPRESFKIRVILESRYGTCFFPSARAEMTLPKRPLTRVHPYL